MTVFLCLIKTIIKKSILKKNSKSYIIIFEICYYGDDLLEESWLKIAELLLSRESNLWLITTILLITYIGISKARLIICKFLHKDICKTNKETVGCEKLTQKDFVYLAVITAILSVFLLSLSFYNDSDAVNLFSFASTLSSMILSVIAIILTIISETRNASTKDKLEISATQIQSATSLLETATQNIDPQLLQMIDDKIEKLDYLMQEAIVKITSAEENSRATREAFEQKMIEGDLELLNTRIPEEPTKVIISPDKFKRKEGAE